jgi:hypothetical protein
LQKKYISEADKKQNEGKPAARIKISKGMKCSKGCSYEDPGIKTLIAIDERNKKCKE